MRIALIVDLLLVAPLSALASESAGARDLGVPFNGTPGPLNAITDVAGVTEGAIVNALPHDRVQAALRKYGRL